MTDQNIEQRKKGHLEICLNEKVEVGSTQFENVTLVHKATPETNFDEISTETEFLGKKLKMPLMIAAVTGGIPQAAEINKDLAAVAEEYGIGFGLGSQRAMIEKPERKESYYVRDVAPNALVLGNMGITQIKQFSAEQVKNALESVKADGLCVHINPAQEMFQKKGDRDFKGCLDDLKKLCSELPFPVIGKEVGNGMNKETAQQLKAAGVKAIDVGGQGGTSWVLVDAIGAGKDPKDFKEWGIPTACSILEVKTAGLPIIATGGIRTGLDVAKSIALGASICGIALPFLRIWKKEGKEGLEKYVEKLQEELKTAMHLSGCKNIDELRKVEYVLSGKVYEWAQQRKLL